MENDLQSPEEQLSHLFGGYRAEWLKGQIFELFTKPAYFPELETARPCMLVGGRGTGKTTALLGLSYEGRFALSGEDTAEIDRWSYYGLYYRVNTNRVTAFNGPELTETQWIPLFAHYFNLVLCEAVFRFLDWYQLYSESGVELSNRGLSKIAASFNLENAASLRDLSDKVGISKTRFEAYINNVIDADRPPLSMQGAPLDSLLEALLELPQFESKDFFFLLDEYENFEPYQQQVVNTLIKHCGELYTFKVGVKELGIRRRTTLNPNEQLISPADYERINIAEKFEGENFKRFALAVCNERISKLHVPGEIIRDVQSLLPYLPEDLEAEKLGVASFVERYKEQMRKGLSPDEAALLDELPLLMIYLLGFWAESKTHDLSTVFQDFISNRHEWDERYDNYKHALLYTIRRGKRGIQKFFSGWDVFTQLAATNIRYLLELVDQSLLLHLQSGRSLADPVSFELQTQAAHRIGKKNLSELEGLTVHGAQLTKLLLGLGRVFQIMASDARGHAPEVNQFHLSDQSRGDEIENLLSSAVMHLALIRSPGNKLADEADTREYDYRIHPIYSAFFDFSYRRKRKMMLSGAQLIGLIKTPKSTIREILAQSNRTYESDEPLPDQLRLFESYYHADT
jgi:hypothetical protein